MFKFIDIHTHLLSSNNPFAIINLNIENAIKRLPSDEINFYSIGIHPWEINNIDLANIAELEQIVLNKKIIAIGECGLDKNIDNIEKQTVIFEKHIVLSENVKKPLIIHCVGCFNELLRILKKHKPSQPWIIHGFRGKPEILKQLILNNIYISYGEKLNTESLKITPINRLCIETDESKLSIETIYSNIAKIKNCNVEDLNASNILFDFSLS